MICSEGISHTSYKICCDCIYLYTLYLCISYAAHLQLHAVVANQQEPVEDKKKGDIDIYVYINHMLCIYFIILGQ